MRSLRRQARGCASCRWRTKQGRPDLPRRGNQHSFVKAHLKKQALRRVAATAAGLRVKAFVFIFLLGCEAAVAQDATPQEYPKYGLLRERDLTPFGFLRLDMRPANAIWAPPGSWGVEVLLGYQNTWVMSPNVEHYLKSLPGRRTLGPADVAAIRALPGEAYLVDLELGLVDVTLHRMLTDHWSVNATISGMRYGGGILYGTLEGLS